MKHWGLRSIITFPVTMLMAAAAAAQLSPEYASWADGPEGFLLTKKERSEWQEIRNDAEAKAFIELFWARRNPDPAAGFNTFRAEFQTKVRYADEHFGADGHRGALSDRAKVLILMGRPEGVQTRGPQQNLPPVGSASGGSDSVEGSTQIWFYDPAKLPAAFKAKGSQMLFMFYEEQPDSNLYLLDRSNRQAFKGLTALEGAPEALLLHPALKEAPKPVTLAGARPASSAVLAWLDQAAPFNESARVLVEAGVSDGGNRPLWLHLELPPEAPVLDVLGGRVSTAAGEILSTFEIAATSLAGQYGKAYHLSLPLDPGTYTVAIAGGAAGAVQFTETLEVEVVRAPAEGTWLSPLTLAVSAQPEQDARLGAPFNFGGWHLVPMTGPDLSRAAEVVFFGFVMRPQTDEQGHVDLKARVQLSRDGRPLGRPLTMPLDAALIVGDLYMYGSSIPLSALPEAGGYELEFEIMEGASETAIERLLPFEIVD